MAFSFPNSPYRYHLDFPVLSSRASGRFLVLPYHRDWHPREAIERVAFKLRGGKLRKKQDWTTFAPSTTVDQSHPFPRYAPLRRASKKPIKPSGVE